VQRAVRVQHGCSRCIIHPRLPLSISRAESLTDALMVEIRLLLSHPPRESMLAPSASVLPAASRESLSAFVADYRAARWAGRVAPAQPSCLRFGGSLSANMDDEELREIVGTFEAGDFLPSPRSSEEKRRLAVFKQYAKCQPSGHGLILCTQIRPAKHCPRQ
jgi:hypothetical protein